MRKVYLIAMAFALVALNACATGYPRVDNATQTGGAMAVNGGIAGAVIGMAFGMPPEAGAKIGAALGLAGGVALGATNDSAPQRGERPAGTELAFGERGVAVLNNYREPIIIQIAGVGNPVHRVVQPLQQVAFPLYGVGGRTVYVTAFATDQQGRPAQELAETSVSFQWGHCVGGGCADQGQRFLKLNGNGRFSY
jgi:hypothetical protein